MSAQQPSEDNINMMIACSMHLNLEQAEKLFKILKENPTGQGLIKDTPRFSLPDVFEELAEEKSTDEAIQAIYPGTTMEIIDKIVNSPGF